MPEKVKWGVLGAANIARKKVIPGMQRGDWCEITALASRDLAKAHRAAEELGIPKSYGSYEELLADPEIEAIYNPLPNHLHVPWTIKAAEAGKHVLCEKPIGLNVQDALPLLEDAETRTDILTSALLDFRQGQSAISCSTRMTPFQRVQIMGTRGRIEVQIPVNAPPDRPCRILKNIAGFLG